MLRNILPITFKHVEPRTIIPVIAGRITFSLGKWKELTCDPAILSAVTGYRIEIVLTPLQVTRPGPISFCHKTLLILTDKIANFLAKGVITESSHEEGEFISNIFLRPKKDGSFRIVLHLKDLNQFVKYQHIKMDSIHTCTQLMRSGCYMACIDLKDAYYSVSIDKKHQKYLKFILDGTLYKFTCLAQGLSSAPRLFTKIMKPVFSHAASGEGEHINWLS